MTEFKYQPPAPIPSKKILEGGEDLAFIRPDGPSRCKWKPGANLSEAPHEFQPHRERPKILPDVLHAVGNTPLIRLNKIPQSYGIKCEMLAKCEYFNPAGSVKDRIAIRMIEDAERRGLLKPGDTIIEPTSGNTGIGLAMGAAVKGYRCIIVLPLKMSNEKVDALRALGAEVIRTPTAVAFDSPEGLISVAQKLCKQIPNSIILDQYRNAFNPIAHYENTAEEIINQCDGKLDAVVCGAGTGGTVTGIGRKIKDVLPSCKVFGADPLGSSLAYPDELNATDVSFYEVEGIGYDFIPTVLDRSVVNQWYKTNDKESLTMARRLIREEGLFCGGSSGSAMTVAIQVAKTMSADQRVVVVLPDGMRNYMSKFINDQWMKARDFQGFEEQSSLWWANIPVNKLTLRTPTTLPSTMDCAAAIGKMKEEYRDFVFVTKNGQIIGAVTAAKILTHLTESKLNLEDSVEKAIDPVRLVDPTTPLARISFILQKEKLVLVKKNPKACGCKNDPGPKFTTSNELLDFICNRKDLNKNGE